MQNISEIIPAVYLEAIFNYSAGMNERTGKWRETEGFALSYSSWRTRQGWSGFQVWAISGCNFVLWVYWQSKLNCKRIAESRGISWQAQCSILWNIKRNFPTGRVARELLEASREGLDMAWAGVSPNCFPNFSSRAILAGISHRGHSQRAHPAKCSFFP